MTKSALCINDIKRLTEPGTTYNVSERLFYRRYSFCLAFEFINVWSSGLYKHHEDTVGWQQYYRLKKLHTEITDYLLENKIDYRLRREVNFSVFINDIDVIKYLLDRYRHILTYVAGPVNEHHAEQIKNNTKISVRKDLFHKKYRYKLTYLANADFVGTGALQIADILESGESDYKLSRNFERVLGLHGRRYGTNNRNYRVSAWDRCTVYLTDEVDYLQIKLMCGTSPVTDQQAMLISEVEKINIH